MRAVDPGDRLLAIFDVFDEWLQRTDFEGCSVIHVVHQATGDYMARIRTFVGQRGRRRRSGPFACQWHILMKGSIVAAGEGDHLAARPQCEIGALPLRQKHGS